MTGTPEDLLAAARSMVEQRDAATRGVWPRAAALLARQALEAAILRLEPDLADATGRDRLLCLPELLDDAELAGRASWAWGALSRATHHHAYDLPPTAEELDTLFRVVERLVDEGPDQR